MSEKRALIQMDHQGDISWVTLNRPGDRNSINTPLMKEIEQALVEAEKSTARAVIFTGAGDTFFCGGADAVEMIQYDPDGAAAFSKRIQNLFDRMEASPLILAAALNGLCYGGGFELALACDFRIAAETSRMGLPEVRVGIIPGGGGTQRLSGIVGKGKAMEVILKGRLYKARDALAMGLVHQVAPLDELHSAVEGFLEPIFKNPQHALSNAKRAIQASHNASFTDGLAVERNEFKACFKDNFFIQEICGQIKSGVMPTTTDLPDWVREKMK